MSMTYQAVLNGNVLEWEREAPPIQEAVHVQVIIKETLTTSDSSRGQRMASALEKLTQSSTFAEIDGAQWQREVRADRDLPGRED